VLSVLNSDFSILSHPVREYINQLAAWDGTDRVHELATHLVAEPVADHQTAEGAQQDIEWALHKWLVAMVATWLDDRLANHQVLTLIGEQGIYKSTFFRHLLPTPLRGYFWENAHNSFSAKDDKLAIAENCLVEIEEIEATEGRQMAELKALVTAESINERRPYALFRKQKARLASFCASGNEQRFLTDQTGNRRWLCFKVSHIDDPRQWNLDYDQLYAQLRDEYLHGFQFWFDKEEEQRVERLNEPFRLASIEEQLISHRLRKPKNGEVPKKMNASMISVFLGGGHLSSQISARKIANIMRKMGFKWKHHRDGDYYYVVEIGLNEVQHYLSDNEQLGTPF
jgi:predicted P-loop ATPase